LVHRGFELARHPRQKTAFLLLGVRVRLAQIPDAEKAAIRAVRTFYAELLDTEAPTVSLALGAFRLTLPAAALRADLRRDPTLQLARAIAERRSGDLASAERHLAALLAERPFLAEAWYELALLQLGAGRRQEARRSVALGLKARPGTGVLVGLAAELDAAAPARR
jgi:predicted Zn-dependent protease